MVRNVKAMIKFIEEDEGSFARIAEMYYQKRPGIIKLVEFYRVYHALAERYDHAICTLRKAHRTMTFNVRRLDKNELIECMSMLKSNDQICSYQIHCVITLSRIVNFIEKLRRPEK